MTGNQIGKLLGDLWADLQNPLVLWQIGALAAALAIAWGVSRMLERGAVRRAGARGGAAGHVAGGLMRVAFPLAAMLAVLVAREGLEKFHHVNLLSLAIPLFGSLAAVRFVVYLFRLAFAPGGWALAFERAIAALIWGALALHITGLLPGIVELLESVQFAAGRQKFTLLGILQSLFWVLLSMLLALWAGSAVEARLMRTEELHSSLRVVLGRIGKALILIAAIVVVLPLIGVDLTFLSVFGGALGVGLGLGLQKIASNYASGFIILLDRSVRLGDIVTADNHYGEVKQITTRYVVVRALNGVEAIIPNDTLITSTVLNHSYSDKKIRLAVKVQAAYGNDVDRVIGLLETIAQRQPRVLEEPPPLALVSLLADSGIEFELGFWIDDPEAGRRNVESDVMRDILREFAAAGIEIPFPQRQLRFAGPLPAAAAPPGLA